MGSILEFTCFSLLVSALWKIKYLKVALFCVLNDDTQSGRLLIKKGLFIFNDVFAGYGSKESDFVEGIFLLFFL
jgi:hypothetical protein